MNNNKIVMEIGLNELHMQAQIERLFDKIMHNQRYVHDEFSRKVSDKILNFVGKYCIRELPIGTPLFRARIHPVQFEEYRCFPDDEMVGPPSDKAVPGRLNPVGIPYLYTSFLDKTAISEVRPWIGAELTVVTFETISVLKVVDTTIYMDLNLKDDDSVFLFSWISSISHIFSRPIHIADLISYIPTQFLAELFKMNNYNGVIYNSSMHSDGKNLLLFDKSFVKIKQKTKIEVQNVNVTYGDAIWNPNLK